MNKSLTDNFLEWYFLKYDKPYIIETEIDFDNTIYVVTNWQKYSTIYIDKLRINNIGFFQFHISKIINWTIKLEKYEENAWYNFDDERIIKTHLDKIHYELNNRIELELHNKRCIRNAIDKIKEKFNSTDEYRNKFNNLINDKIAKLEEEIKSWKQKDEKDLIEYYIDETRKNFPLEYGIHPTYTDVIETVLSKAKKELIEEEY